MKAWYVAIASLALGLVAGCGLTWYEFAQVRETFDLGSSATEAGSEKTPRVTIEGGAEHVFGIMEVQATKSHEFFFKNIGTAPLVLEKKGEPTCQCTRFEVPTEEIEPGASAKVLIEWTPKSADRGFSQSAEVKTNDPQMPLVRLQIRGSVVRFAEAVPAEFALSNISANEEKAAEVLVYTYTSETVQVASHKFLVDDSAAFFEARYEPLSADAVKQEKFASAGVRLVLTAKSGLPLGPINQTIRLTYEGPEGRTIDIPIKGSVGSDISIVGANFDVDQNTLRLGLVKGSVGSKTELRLSVKGPHRHDVKLALAEVDPAEVLKVTLGEPKEINNGKAVVFPLIVEIPPGSPPVNRIASEQRKPGRIVLKVAEHPGIQQLKIGVNFAVQE